MAWVREIHGGYARLYVAEDCVASDKPRQQVLEGSLQKQASWTVIESYFLLSLYFHSSLHSDQASTHPQRPGTVFLSCSGISQKNAIACVYLRPVALPEP